MNLNKKNNYSSFWLNNGWDNNTSIFDGNIRQVMSQKRLGISNNYPLNISQDSLNPTLRQTVKQYINIIPQFEMNSYFPTLPTAQQLNILTKFYFVRNSHS